MAILVHAPMSAILAGLVASLALYDRLGSPLVVLLCPLFSIAISLCTYQREVRGRWPVLLALVASASACAARTFVVLDRPPFDGPRVVEASGTVSQVRPWGRLYAVVLDAPGGGLLMQLPFASLTPGTRLAVRGVASPFPPVSRGGFDAGRYWRAHGVVARLSSPEMEPLPARWSLARVRHAISRALVIRLPPLTSAHLRAVLTGERDPSLFEAHRAWGTSHLLAVSGFHVGVVALLASLVLGRGRPVALSVVIWGYVLLAGAAPSAVRAALMFQAALAARALGRPVAALNGPCLAAVLLLLYRPFLFWDLGWRLSVLAALTIAALHEGTRLRGARAWLLISPAIAIVTFPQVARTSTGVPVVGLLLNLFAPALFSVAFPVALGVAALSAIGLPVGWLLRAVEGGFVLWERVADGLSALAPWTVSWGPALAWAGAGTLMWLLCRALRLSPGHGALLVTGLSLASFVLFL